MQEMKAITLGICVDCLILYRIENWYKSWKDK